MAVHFEFLWRLPEKMLQCNQGNQSSDHMTLDLCMLCASVMTEGPGYGAGWAANVEC